MLLPTCYFQLGQWLQTCLSWTPRSVTVQVCTVHTSPATDHCPRQCGYKPLWWITKWIWSKFALFITPASNKAKSTLMLCWIDFHYIYQMWRWFDQHFPLHTISAQLLSSPDWWMWQVGCTTPRGIGNPFNIFLLFSEPRSTSQMHVVVQNRDLRSNATHSF